MRDKPKSKSIIDVWVPQHLILSKHRPAPLLMHTTPLDKNPELAFWNLLRKELNENIKVNYFDDISEAGSIVVAPNALSAYFLEQSLKSIYQFSKEVVKSNRKIVIFTGGIEHKPNSGEIVFATSTYRFENETSIPVANWLYSLESEVSLINKPAIPTLGFVGNVAYPGRLSNFLGALPIPDKLTYHLAGSHLFNRSFGLGIRRSLARLFRQSVIKTIEEKNDIETRFLARKKDFFQASREEKERSREEFLDNIRSNAYQLCMRGDENCSYRLYEVMSAGRIPVIIDTNVLLPKLKSFTWKDFSIIIPCHELERTGEIIRSFHKNLSSEEFKQVCLTSKLAFEELLPHNYLLDALRARLHHDNV